MNWPAFYTMVAKSKDKYSFYDGNFSYDDFDNAKMSGRFKSRVGWARRAVDMRANKTHFDKFENDTIGLNDIFDEYYVRDALDMITDDILVCGVGFLALANDRVMPFTAMEATGTYNWREKNLKSGVAVYRENTKKNFNTQMPDSYVKYQRYQTISYKSGEIEATPNPTGRPLMGILTHRATTRQPFGRSVISSAAREAVISASRTTRQMEIAGFHYNSKVNVILGVDSDTPVNKVEMKTGDALTIGTNENGQMPAIGEFAQHAMAPFNDEILTFGKNFCAATTLDLANINLSTSAPQSSKASDVVSDELADDIEKWQREMGGQLKYFTVTLWMLKNNVTEIDENLRAKINAISPVWKPILRVDIAKVGDGINKVAQLEPAVLQARSIWRNLGFSSDEIDKIIANATDSAQNL